MTTTTGHPDLALCRRLLREVGPYWPPIAGSLLLSLLACPLALLAPLPLKIAVDSAVGSRPLPGWLDALLPAAVPRSDTAVLVLAAGLAVAVALLGQLQGLATALLSTYAGEQLVLNFRTRLFGHAQRLSLSY